MASSSPAESGMTDMGKDIMKLKHTVKVPMALLSQSGPVVTPWFTNSELAMEDLYFRLRMIKEPPGLNLRLWLQAASVEEMERLGMDANVTTLPNHTGTLTAFFLSRIKLLVSPWLDPKDMTYLSTSKPVGYIQTTVFWRLLTKDGDIYRKFWDRVAGELTLRLSLELIRPVVGTFNSTGALSFKSNSAQRSSVLEQMLTRKLFPDVKLKLGKETLSAHRAVLAASSQVFEAFFNHDTKENQTGVLDIQDVGIAAMEATLDYIYGVDITHWPSSLLMDVLPVAEKYAILDLKEYCEEILKDANDVDVLELLWLSDIYNAPTLRDATLRRIARSPNRKYMVNHSTLRNVAKSHPNLLADLVKVLL